MIADYQGPDKLAVLKFSIAIVYLIWDAIYVTYTYQVSPVVMTARGGVSCLSSLINLSNRSDYTATS